MNENVNEDLIDELCDEFMRATPTATDEHKFGFKVGARSMIFELGKRGLLQPQPH